MSVFKCQYCGGDLYPAGDAGNGLVLFVCQKCNHVFRIGEF